MKKYRLEPTQTSGAPPSHMGSFPLTAAAMAAKKSPTPTLTIMACRMTDWTCRRRPAPMSWAIWIEKPVTMHMPMPLKSQVLLATRPTEAVAAAPRDPTMAEST